MAFLQSTTEALKQYVRPDQPFGPPDAADVKEPECAAAMYDWKNKAFAEMLAGSDVLVGRRGSGKSSLLSSFPARKFLLTEFKSEEGRDFRDRFHIAARDLNYTPDFIVDIDTPTEVNEMEIHCLGQPNIPPIEVLAERWRRRLWWLVGQRVEAADGDLWTKLPKHLKAYIRNEDLAFSDDPASQAGQRVTGETFIKELQTFLVDNKVRIVATFDNVEEHTFTPTRNAVLGGLIAATGKFIGAQNPTLDVKLCLPAELFRLIEKIAFRPDKDLHRVQYLHWNAAELLHLAARRLRVFMSIWNEDQFDLIKDRTLSDRADLMAFWHRFFPARIKNSLGLEEDTITYILRHTQMLPRQVILVLNAISKRSGKSSDALFAEPFTEYEVIKGIEDTEKPNVAAVLFMFQRAYPEIHDMLRVVMPRLRREFDYGYLQSVWQSSGKIYMERMQRPDFISFWELLLSIGALGLQVEEESTDLYSCARFEFNTKYPISISEKDRLCVHPMFSRIYNVERPQSARTVLPRGSDFQVDRGHI